MQEIISNTLPIFLITALGAFIKKHWIVSTEFWKGIEKLSYFILFPAVIFNYISISNFHNIILHNLIFALMISTCIISLILVFYQKKYNINPVIFTSMFQGATRYNNYIFFALGRALFDNIGISIISIISSYMIIFTNFLSILIYAYYIPDNFLDKSKKEIFFILVKLLVTNPLIIASVLGFIVNYTHVFVHSGIKHTIISLSDAALAIGLLNVGSSLKFVLYTSLFKQIFLSNIIKLIIFPVVTVCVLHVFPVNDIARSVGVLYSCLPCASTAYVLSSQLRGDTESMITIITFSTLFSMISIPIVIRIFS